MREGGDDDYDYEYRVREGEDDGDGDGNDDSDDSDVEVGTLAIFHKSIRRSVKYTTCMHQSL